MSGPRGCGGPRPAARALLPAAALLVVAACAGPGVTLRLAPGAAAELARARTVWIDGAVATRAPAAPGAGPTTERLDAALRAALATHTGLEPAADRASADVVVLYAQSDTLACPGCPEPGPFRHWWAFLRRPEGGELASLHGEVARAAGREPLVVAVRRIGRLVR